MMYFDRLGYRSVHFLGRRVSECLCWLFFIFFMAVVPAEGAAVSGAANAAKVESLPDPQYVIGPGDQIQIFVWQNPELSVTISVRPDGKISSPLVEDMIAVGKTPSQLARDIQGVLSKYIRSPQVNVIVSGAVSTLSQVKVIGQVVKPQALPYREGMTLLDVILQAGGLAPYAAGNRAKVVRLDKGKEVEIKVRLVDLVEDGDMKQNIAVRPGDILVVPQSRF